jgi:hypothetical protein
MLQERTELEKVEEVVEGIRTTRVYNCGQNDTLPARGATGPLRTGETAKAIGSGNLAGPFVGNAPRAQQKGGGEWQVIIVTMTYMKQGT